MYVWISFKTNKHLLILYANKMRHIRKQPGNISVWCFGSLQNILLLVFLKTFLMLKFTFWGCDTAREKLLDAIRRNCYFSEWKWQSCHLNSQRKMCRHLGRNWPDVAKGPQGKGTVAEVWTTRGFQLSTGLRCVFRRSSAAFRSIRARKARRRVIPVGWGAAGGAPGEGGVGACEGGSGSEEEGFVILNRIVCDGKWRCYIALHVG